jgi:hypothetical protein
MVTRAIMDAWEIPLAFQAGTTFVSKRVGGVVAARPDGSNGSGTNDPIDWYPTGK